MILFTVMTKAEIINKLIYKKVFYNNEIYIVYPGGWMEPKRGRIFSWNMLTQRDRINLKKQKKTFLEYLYDNIKY